MNDPLAMAWAGIVATGTVLSSRGLAPGSSGNLSVRQGDRVVITPTGTELAELGFTAPSVLATDGTHLSGPRPSKEWPVHLAMLAARTWVGAVVHLHAPFSTALSCLEGLPPDDVLPAFTAYFAMRVGRLVLVPYHPPGAPELAAATAAAARTSGALLLANHGLVASGRDLADARGVAEEIEATARLRLLLHGLPARPLDDRQAEAVRRDWDADPAKRRG